MLTEDKEDDEERKKYILPSELKETSPGSSSWFPEEDGVSETSPGSSSWFSEEDGVSSVGNVSSAVSCEFRFNAEIILVFNIAE